MGTKYSSQASAGYNASPPPDDGSQSASNLITWAGIKTKIGDVLKTFAEAINTALVAALDYSTRQITIADSGVASDNMRTVEIAPTVSATITFALGDAAGMTSNYLVRVRNSSTIAQTIGRITGTDTIDGTAANIRIPSKSAVWLAVNSAATGYLTVGQSIDNQSSFGRLNLTGLAGTNTITATGPAELTALAAGQIFAFTPAGTNTGATTLNITPSGGTALTAKNVFWNGAACVGGEIRVSVPCQVYYDGTQFQIIGSASMLQFKGTAPTANRIPYAVGASSLYQDSSAFTFDGSTFTAPLATITNTLTLAASTGYKFSGIDAGCFADATFQYLAKYSTAEGLKITVATGAATFTQALTLNSTLTYGGVTLTAGVTGTGSMALSASPTFTGTPVAPTAAANANSTQIATTAYVDRYATLGTSQATTSGTAKTFTVSATAKKITVMFSGVSLSGTSNFRIQIGPSGAAETSGYLGSGSGGSNGSTLSCSTDTAGFIFPSGSATAIWHGALTLTLEKSSTNNWIATGQLGRSDTNGVAWCAGAKPCAGAVDTVVVTTINGTDTFDAGEISILTEG